LVSNHGALEHWESRTARTDEAGSEVLFTRRTFKVITPFSCPQSLAALKAMWAKARCGMEERLCWIPIRHPTSARIPLEGWSWSVGGNLMGCNSLARLLSWTGASWKMSKTIQKAISSILRHRLRVMWRDEIALGPGKAELLALVEETGSINEAAHRMGMSYMRAWSLIKTMNRCFQEPLVVAERGGRGGGGAKLTATGRRSLELYHQMEKASQQATRSGWRALQKLLRE
jgi:molybdate transport system regulatory protein